MIGCDHCSEWYHLTCIGISLVQVEKCEQYTCPRCLMSNLIVDCANMAALIANKWTNLADHFKIREPAAIKVCFVFISKYHVTNKISFVFLCKQQAY